MVNFSNLPLCILLALAKDVSMQFKDLGDIDCGYNSKCRGKETCTVTCSSGCNTPGATPWLRGSTVYGFGSSICRSAVHDYRIPSYGSDKYNVTFQRISHEGHYHPTIQNGIISKMYVHQLNAYTFLSPRVQEDILDVTVLSFTNLYPENGEFRQECSIYDRQRTNSDLEFEFYMPQKEKQQGAENKAEWKEVSWTNKQLHPGGYWCYVTSNTYSRAMSLTMREDADFIPDQWTLTANPNQNVVIKFTPRPGVNTKKAITWKKDQIILYSFTNMKKSHDQSAHYLNIDNISFGDGGIYSVELVGKPKKKGIMRLIVRRCPEGYFGDCCAAKCPECQNGGVCHDIMGTCICAPGFAGHNCEDKCKKDCFGQSCTQCCDLSRGTKDGSCKGAVICQPDPYGCSCAAGYTGLKCEENSGRYRRHAGGVADPFKNKSNTQIDKLCNLENRSH